MTQRLLRDKLSIPELKRKSIQYRKTVLSIIKNANAGHTGGDLSCVDILNVLYNYALNVSPANFKDPNRDRYIQSKGHSAEILYTVLADKGFYPRQELLKLIEKRNRKMYPITIDGKPTRRRDVRSTVHDAILKEALGDYISASDVRNKAGISNSTLRGWRHSGKVRAKKVGRAWHYSKQDLLELMRTPQV